MVPEKPPGLPQVLWDRVLANRRAEEEFRERKARFLSSLETGDDRIMDRALEQLTADEEEIRAEKDYLHRKLKGYGIEL